MRTVSVIVTTCNREPRVLKEALESVLSQSYRSFEVIVVNDSPEYNKRKEIESLVFSFGNKVKYLLNEESKGANYARNIGVHNSGGDIISFLDDDDYWHTDRLKKIVSVINDGTDIVYSDFVIFTDNRKRYSKRVFPSKKDQLEMALAGNYLGGFSNVSFTRKLFEACGELDERMPSYQDQDLFIRLLQHGKLGYINEGLSFYRINANSISLSEEKKMRGLIMFFKKYKRLFEQYPDSKRRRLESELIYARKQGWSNNSKIIKKMLCEYDSKFHIFKTDVKGYMKYVAVNIFKLQ